MQNNVTELVFILDRSGSMAGFNEQRKKKTVERLSKQNIHHE